MGNCFGNIVQTFRSRPFSRASSVDAVNRSDRLPLANVSDDVEYENFMMQDETIEAVHRKYKNQIPEFDRLRSGWYINRECDELLPKERNAEATSQKRSHGITLSSTTPQIVDPSLLASSTITADSNYHSWISDLIEDSPFEPQQCEVFVTSAKKRSLNNNIFAKFKSWKRSPFYSQLSTPTSDMDLEWEPEASLLPFMSNDLRNEYLNNFNGNVTVGVENFSSNQSTPVHAVRQPSSSGTPNNNGNLSRVGSPTLEWDPDDVLDHETLQLLTEIDRIVAQSDNASDGRNSFIKP